MTSLSRDGQHSLGAVLNHVEGSVAEGWYWQVEGDTTTLLGILNADSEEATIHVWLDYFSDGQARRYDLPDTVIPGRGTALIDLSEYAGSGLPDADGDVIPPGVVFGGYRVRKVAGGTTRRLTTEALVVNRRTKTFLPLYNTCCGYTAVSSQPNSITGPVGSSAQVTLFASNSCSGIPEPVPANWSSSNSNVASVNSSGSVSLNNPGNATITGSAFVEFAQPGCDPGVQPGIGDGDPIIVCCGCITAQRSGSSSVTVKPTITVSCNNPHLALGSTAPPTTKNGTCSTTVSPSGGSYSWSASKTTITLSPSGGAADYTAASASMAQNDTVISVLYTVNGQSALTQSAPITVHKPTSLSLDSDASNPTGQTCNVPCLSNPSQTCTYQSYKRTRTYTILDQFGLRFPNVGIGSADVQESLPFSSSCPNVSFNTIPATTTTFHDDFFFCHSECLSGGSGCTTTASQTISVNGFAVRTVSVVWTCTGVSCTP